MKKSFLILFLCLIFVSCATTKQNEIEREHSDKIILCHESLNEILIPVRGIQKEDGSIAIVYPDSPEYENAGYCEVSFEEVPSYYVYEEKKGEVTSYYDSANNSRVHVLKKEKEFQVICIEGKFGFFLEDKKVQSEMLLVNLSKKMKPINDKSENIIGTWIDAEEYDEDSKRKFTFLQDGVFINENLIENEFYNYFSRYQVLTENIIDVQTITVSKITGKSVLNPKLYYFDGKYLYDIIFPLRDVSDDKSIKDALIRTKWELPE